MEALVNNAYDRISEDVILLYDAMRAYNQAPSPKPPVSAVLQAMYRCLMKDHTDKTMGHPWSLSHEDDLAGMGRVPSWRAGDSGVEGHLEGDGRGVDIDIFAESEDEEDLVDASTSRKESQLWELARFLVTSMLSDFAVMPFWTVKVSAVAHRGRLPELWPFVGYRKAIMAVIQREGPAGLFKAWVPICAAGLLRYFRRSKLLYTDYYWKTTYRVTTRLIMQPEKYNRHVNDPEVLAQSYEGLVTRMLWATILHPFDLLATRMITESRPEYDTMASSIRHVLQHRGIAGLFLGVRSSILNVVMPFGNWYLLGVPFLIKTRRMLDGMDTVFRAGMGGSLDMVRAILKEEGFLGLFAGYRASLWGVVPAFASLCGARLLVYMLMGSSPRTSAHRRRRNAHLRSLMRNPQTPMLRLSRRPSLHTWTTLRSTPNSTPQPHRQRMGTRGQQGAGGHPRNVSASSGRSGRPPPLHPSVLHTS